MRKKETENLMRHTISYYTFMMEKASDIEVCEKIITLAKEVIKENGGHDIRLYAKDSKGRVLI